MAINTGKVFIGGLAAGVVLNICDFLSNTYIMADRFKTDLDALNPALMTNIMAPSNTVSFVVLDFVYGLLTVFTYAAIRPRFGAGAGTAVKAGLMMWAIGGITWYFTVVMGLFSMNFFVMSAMVSLVTMLAASYVGAMLYKED
ncbi:MAG: hypothetical protein IPP90_06765 [Gemmatimonadaceae bacterium]|nr:hypothetical protein [Gemmatimonadaceae bacterium]